MPGLSPQLPASRPETAEAAALRLARASLEALALKVGQVLDAKVLGTNPNGLTQLSIAGQLLNVKVPVPLPAGTQLQLQVQAGGPQGLPVLVAQTPPQPAAMPPLPGTAPSLSLPEVSVPAPSIAAPPVTAPQPQPAAAVPPQAPSGQPSVPSVPQLPPATAAPLVPGGTPPTAAPMAPPAPAPTVAPAAPGPVAVTTTAPHVVAPHAPPPPGTPAVTPALVAAAPAPVAAPQVQTPPPAQTQPPASQSAAPAPLPPAAAAPISTPALAGAPPSPGIPIAQANASPAPVAPLAQGAPVVTPAPPPPNAVPPTAPPTMLPSANPETPAPTAPMPAGPSAPPPATTQWPATAMPMRTPSPPPPAPPPAGSVAEANLNQATQAAARQDSMAPLLQNLSALQGRIGEFPRPVVEAALRLLAGRINLDRAAPTGEGLKQAVLRSGIFLEALGRPAMAQSPPQGDAKAALLALRGALTAWLGQDLAPVAPVARRPQPPTRGAQPRGLRSEAPTLPEAAAPKEAGRTLLGQAEAALSRVRLQQLASLPHDAARTASLGPAAAAAEWNLEVPMLLGHELAMAQLQISRDGKGKGERRERGWRMAFSLNFSALGEVGAQVSLFGQSASVLIWAEEDETATALAQMLPELTPALMAKGLAVGSVRVRHGRPKQVQPQSGQLLDSVK